MGRRSLDSGTQSQGIAAWLPPKLVLYTLHRNDFNVLGLDRKWISLKSCGAARGMKAWRTGWPTPKFGCPIFATVSSSLRWAIARKRDTLSLKRPTSPPDPPPQTPQLPYPRHPSTQARVPAIFHLFTSPSAFRKFCSVSIPLAQAIIVDAICPNVSFSPFNSYPPTIRLHPPDPLTRCDAGSKTS